MKRVFIRTAAVVISLLIIAFSLRAFITDFGNNPLALVSEKTVKGISIDRTASSETVVLSERDCEVLLAVMEQVKFVKYKGDFDGSKFPKGSTIIHIERIIFPDIELYLLPRISSDSSVSLLCVNGSYYTAAPDSQMVTGVKWTLKIDSVIQAMFPDRRPRLKINS